MASDKTSATELAVACGLIEKEINDSSDFFEVKNVPPKDAGKVWAWINAQASNQNLFNTLWALGSKVKGKIPLPPSTEISWTGGSKQTTGVAAAKDLIVHVLPGMPPYHCSVKVDSDIVWNGSMSRLEELTKGVSSHSKKGVNWFSHIAPVEYENLFQVCGGPEHTGCKTAIQMDNARRGKPAKKQFSEHCSELIKQPGSPADIAYRNLTNAVSVRTASLFNANLQDVLNNHPGALKTIFWDMFRLNSIRYILCGTEGVNPFAIWVLGKDEMDRKFKVTRIEATPNQAKQPEVIFLFEFQNKETKQKFIYTMRLEARWSHGKFCGNPESKLYKNFKYAELPWVEILV